MHISFEFDGGAVGGPFSSFSRRMDYYGDIKERWLIRLAATGEIISHRADYTPATATGDCSTDKSSL